MLNTCAVLAVPLVLLAASAAAAPRVTAYEDDGAITVDGKRTLIIGSYYKAKSDNPYKELADSGFNLVMTPADPKLMDAALDAKLMVWTGVGTLDLANRAKSEADFVEAYPIIKKADPNHLLYTNHAPTNLVKTLQAYNAGTDIVACDIYPVNPGGLKSMFALFPDGYQGDLVNEHISQVGDYTEKMRAVAGPKRPVFMVLQAFAWENLVEPKEDRRAEKVVYPTYEQSRFMAFQALIKGANGIIYWGSDFTPQPSQAWSDLKRVTREVADQAAALAERTSAVAISLDYQEMGHSVDKGVQTLVKEHGGKLYLYTCNADKNICRAAVSGLDGWKTCAVLNESRSLPVEKGGFTDTWKRFDVHVYELSK
ncbi:MAG: hypothetical protein HZB26_17415 [Candidatus Hydrogenedentes bacterium]|nr:hypothetical protein [Candidatus Hydrogenedentota bacterium]